VINSEKRLWIIRDDSFPIRHERFENPQKKGMEVMNGYLGPTNPVNPMINWPGRSPVDPQKIREIYGERHE